MRILMSIIAVLFPWLTLLLKDNPGGAIVALIMQATIIGWPFATMWAWRTIHPVPNSKAESKAESKTVS